MTSAVLVLVALAVVVWTWPRDAVPSLAGYPLPAHGSIGVDPGNHTAIFADSGTARFFQRVQPMAFWLWIALSPVGYLAWRGVRWLADRLHRARTA